MAELVECRSDLNYADTPLAFYWEGRRLEVEELLASWLTPQGKGFRVKAAEDQVFELFYDEGKDTWYIHVPCD
jgi:hypothetical protein